MLTSVQNSSIESSNSIQNAKIKVEANSDHVPEKLERTLGLITCTDNLEDIIDLIKKNGFTIVNTKTTQFTLEQAQELYADLKTQNNYDKMVNWLSSGLYICALVLEKENAVKDWKHLMGPANYKKARKINPNSIRALFGKDASQNATHGSDSETSAEKEIDFVFGDSLVHASDKPLPHNNNDVQNSSAFENGQIHDASNTEKAMEKEESKEDAGLSIRDDQNNKSEDEVNMESSGASVVHATNEDVSKEKSKVVDTDDSHKAEETEHKEEHTSTTVTAEKASVVEEPKAIQDSHLESTFDDVGKGETETIKPTSIGVVNEEIKTPHKTEETHSDAHRANDAVTELVNGNDEPIEEKSSDITPSKDGEQTDESVNGLSANSNEETSLSDKDEDKAEIEQISNNDEDLEIKTVDNLQNSVDEETKEASATVTPSSGRSEKNMTATNSTNVDTEEEEEGKTREAVENLNDESTPEKDENVLEGVDTKEEDETETQVETNSTGNESNSSKTTSGTKGPRKEIATTTSRIKPPSSINKAQNGTRNSTLVTPSNRKALTNNNKPSLTNNKAGTTRIARLSPSATLNKDTPSEKKKPVPSTRDIGTPSVAKKTVTKVSKNLPRVALMATQKPPKTSDKNEEEDVEKKPKKRTSSTRSFISRLTTPTVASANKKTESDTPAAPTNTSKRSSLPSKRSSTVRPIVSSSKDAPLRNKQKREAATNDKQEQPAGGLATIASTESVQ